MDATILLFFGGNKMKSLNYAGLVLIVLVSQNLRAHSDVCDYSVNHNINIDKNSISFSGNASEEIIFTGDELMVNGETLELNKRQMEYSLAFQNETRQMLPKLASIAIESAELGLKATSIVVSSLFGSDAYVHDDLIKPIESITEKIKANVSSTVLNTKEIVNAFDESFDRELENLISTALSKYSGKLLSQIIQNIFSNDREEKADFEFRMENLEHDIETYIETNALAIEVQVENLCENFEKLADLDTKLESVEGYPERGVIEKGHQKGVQISSLSFSDK